MSRYDERREACDFVVPGLVPGIHVLRTTSQTWMAGTSPAMTRQCCEVTIMIPGELFIKDGEIELNAGRKTVTLTMANTGDRPIQASSHYHFFGTNPTLKFHRKKPRSKRLDITAGTAVR